MLLGLLGVSFLPSWPPPVQLLDFRWGQSATISSGSRPVNLMFFLRERCTDSSVYLMMGSWAFPEMILPTQGCRPSQGVPNDGGMTIPHI